MTRVLICTALVITTAGQSGPAAQARMAKGPLRVHPLNPRYFTDATKLPDGSLKAVYVTGSHTWNSLVDMGRSDPAEPFDFNRYLDFLEGHGHNFIRLWAWDSTIWDTRANAKLGRISCTTQRRCPGRGTGPGLALDGKPKFDLTKFDNAYFNRLRERVNAAGRRGIYVSVMLFEGWGLMHANRGRAAPAGWAWRSHPFNPANNVNQRRPTRSRRAATAWLRRAGSTSCMSRAAARSASTYRLRRAACLSNGSSPRRAEPPA